jgi:integrase
LKLTKTSVAGISAPAGKSEVRVFDEDLPGFGLRVLSSGKRAWIIQFRVNGRSTTKTIGRLEKMPVGTARELARRQLAQVELGVNPAEEKKTARERASDTFEPLAARFIRAKASMVRPRTLDQITLHLTKHWAPFNRRSVHDISRRDIAALLGAIAEHNGAVAANRARANLSSFFTWMIREGIAEANPVVGTNKQGDEKSRDRVLTGAELAAIWKACKDDDYGRIIRLLILTAQRRDEVGAIAKSEIGFDARKWTIAGERTKNGRVHEVPLSNSALAILTQAINREGREDRDLLFGETARGFGGWSAAKAALDERIGEQTKKDPWRVHDIRRTAATHMAELGVQPHVVEAVLNHVSGHKAGVAGVYNRALYAAEKRQALDLWAAHLDALITGKPTSNIVPMRA